MCRLVLGICLAACVAHGEPAGREPEGAPKRTPLPSQQNLTVEFENTGTNAVPMDAKLFGGYAHPDYGPPVKGALWWEWRSPETGWYAIDRPDEPDGGSDQYPWPYAFLIGARGVLEKETDEAAWHWDRSGWFWAPKGSRHALCIVSPPGKGRWRLLRLATTLLPEAEQVVMVTPAPGAVASWRLQPARIGVDEQPNAVVREKHRDEEWTFRHSIPPPMSYPPACGRTMEWTWLPEHSGFFVIEKPQDRSLEVEADWLSRHRRSVIFRAAKGAVIKFSAAIKTTHLSELIHLREFPAPSNTSPEQAARLEGVSGSIYPHHPGALGLPEDPVGTYKFERFPLWWKFIAPAAGSFQVTDASTDQIRVTDLRDTEFTMRGSVAVCYPTPEQVAAVIDEHVPERERAPPCWPLRAGEAIWVRGCGTQISFEWKWVEP